MTTRTEFENVYRKFSPDKYELFFLKYISAHGIRETSWFILVSIILSIPFLAQLFFSIFHYSFCINFIIHMIYILLITLFGVYWITIFIKKKKRLSKIRKYLGISKEEYKELIDLYFYNRYRDVNDYIKFNSK